MRKSGARAILLAGLTAGTLDILAAIGSSYFRRGTEPTRVLQSVASGVLGRESYNGGIGAAALGLLLHLVIAFGAATVFYLASRRLGVLVEQAVICGVLYGIAVYFFMQYVVLPLSNVPLGATWNPVSATALLWGIPIHIFCVGLPIALMIRRHS